MPGNDRNKELVEEELEAFKALDGTVSQTSAAPIGQELKELVPHERLLGLERLARSTFVEEKMRANAFIGRDDSSRLNPPAHLANTSETEAGPIVGKFASRQSRRVCRQVAKDLAHPTKVLEQNRA